MYQRLWLKNRYYQEKYIRSSRAEFIISKLYDSNERFKERYFEIEKDNQLPIILSKDISLFITYANYYIDGEEDICARTFKTYIKDVCIPISQYFSNQKKAYRVFAFSMLDVCDNVSINPTDFTKLFESEIPLTKFHSQQYFANEGDIKFALKNSLPYIENVDEVKKKLLDSDLKTIMDLTFDLNYKMQESKNSKTDKFSIQSFMSNLALKNTIDFILDNDDNEKLYKVLKEIDKNDFKELIDISKEYFCQSLDEKTFDISDTKKRIYVAKADADIFSSYFLKLEKTSVSLEDFLNFFYGMFEAGLSVINREKYHEEYKDIIYTNHLDQPLDSNDIEYYLDKDDTVDKLKDSSIILRELYSKIVNNIKECKNKEDIKELGHMVFSNQNIESFEEQYNRNRELFYENYMLTMAWLDQVIYSLVDNKKLLRPEIIKKI